MLQVPLHVPPRINEKHSFLRAWVCISTHAYTFELLRNTCDRCLWGLAMQCIKMEMTLFSTFSGS